MYYRRPDGGLTVLEVNASRITTRDGRQLGVCTFQDVTEEYERRGALREAAERVQLALDAGAIVGTWVWDVQADVLTADELFARTFGLDPERCRTGFSAAEPMVSVHPADRAGVEAAVGEAIARVVGNTCVVGFHDQLDELLQPSRPIGATTPNSAMWPRNRIGKLDPLAHQHQPDPVQHHDALLLRALHVDKAHRRSSDRLADRLRIGRIVLDIRPTGPLRSSSRGAQRLGKPVHMQSVAGAPGSTASR
jgi:hypothetical protein